MKKIVGISLGALAIAIYQFVDLRAADGVRSVVFVLVFLAGGIMSGRGGRRASGQQ